MSKIVLIPALVLFLISPARCTGNHKITPEQKQKLIQLRQEVSDDLTGNILPYWTNRMVDNENGGFYGRIDGNEKVYPQSEKGGILNARILWTYSSAYRVLGDTSYLRIATRARDYILAYFIDRESGGAFMSVNADGTPGNTRKQVYTNAFFIYALAEYSRATGDKASLEEAKKIFDILERHAADREHSGYFEVFNREWERIRERLIGEESDLTEKTMNTSLHVMEAYANLYRVLGDKEVGERLEAMVSIFLEKIIDKNTSHLIPFLDRSWNSTAHIDSYGHDIESSWLLYEAAGLLNDRELLEPTAKASIAIANAAAEGLRPDGGMVTEKNHATGHVSPRRSWWEQAESVVGYLNAFELTGDEAYLEKSLTSWEYIKKNFIDRKNGGWYSYVSESGVPSGDKTGFWICPYHSGRMCMEVFERVKE